MKQLLFACTLAALVAACAHKATPTTSTSAASSGSGSASTTPAAGSNSTATAKVEAGHQVYTAKCGRCHGLKEPSNYTAERWVPILANMAPKARLSEDETAQVAAYVQANAKK